MTESPAEIAKMPFETALAELESIVDKLEKGAVALEDSIKLYERGEALKAHCDRLLKNAEMRIEKIALSADGKPKGVGAARRRVRPRERPDDRRIATQKLHIVMESQEFSLAAHRWLHFVNHIGRKHGG